MIAVSDKTTELKEQTLDEKTKTQHVPERRGGEMGELRLLRDVSQDGCAAISNSSVITQPYLSCQVQIGRDALPQYVPRRFHLALALDTENRRRLWPTILPRIDREHGAVCCALKM